MARWSEPQQVEDVERVLEPDGSVVGDEPDLSEDQLLFFYRTMVLARTLDEKMVKMQRRGQLGLVAQGLGEEATPLGTAAALEPGDWCFPYYRQKPAYLYWNVPPEQIIARRAGFEPETIAEHVPSGEPRINFTPSYTPLAVNVLNAAGSAMADSFADRDVVSMAYVGEGATSEGDFHDGLNFAGVFDVPLVCICQNNGWAISVPAHRQTGAETFAQKAVAYGIEGVRVDGNDVLAVYEQTREAVEQARAGEGPTLVECVTYRLADHNTSDAASVYRDEDDTEEWAERDPIARFETYLRGREILTEERRDEIESEVETEVEEAADILDTMPESEPELMFAHHLHADTPTQRHQRAELERELAGENPFTDFTGAWYE